VINGEEGTPSEAPVYITVDGDRREVSFGETKRRPDITHRFIDLDWPCTQAAPCSPLDYGLALKNPSIAKVADTLAQS